MKDASKAYGEAYEEALNQQLKVVTESTITEDTLKQEMLAAANAHRDSIQKMTAIPPLFMDDTRIQLQIRCAAAEEKAEDLQRKLQVVAGNDSDREVAGLRKELKMSREELGELQKVNQNLHEMLRKVNSEHDRMKGTTKMDESLMIGLKKKLEAAESEIESLKRKRADSVSPERQITGILKRPEVSSPPGQDVPSSSAQPIPKKSRNRKNRWNDLITSVPPKIPPTSINRDGVKGKSMHTSPPRKRDPVLHSSLSSVKRKQDIINDIEESARTLGLSRPDFSLVFYRSTLDEQVAVTRKALAYVEILITSTCVHQLKSVQAGSNPVQAYLDTLSLAQVFALKEDVDHALEQCEDSSRCMAVYQGGDDLLPRVRKQCFTKNGTPLRPHKQDDMLKKLHVRLGCHKLHHIPIGFYYAKWSEKLHFHLAKAGR